MKESTADKKKAGRILTVLNNTYPEAQCELNFKDAFQLLVATVLSAQTTDKKVNKVTEKLFEVYQTPWDFLRMTQGELEEKIKEIGLFRNKAKNILQLCRQLIEKHRGEVPGTMDELVELAGVGRKTANVVLSNAFGVPALAVDTHVFRVSNRLGLAKSSNVEDTEQQLMAVIPREAWSKAHHLLIWHGRRICDARKPKCEICPVALECTYLVTTQAFQTDPVPW
jgi:endonuclease-3